MNEITRNRIGMIVRPVFSIGEITIVFAGTFLKLMPLTLFWVGIAACMYFNVSITDIFTSSSRGLIGVSLVINFALSGILSMNKISDVIDTFYVEKSELSSKGVAACKK